MAKFYMETDEWYPWRILLNRPTRPGQREVEVPIEIASRHDAARKEYEAAARALEIHLENLEQGV